uniref:SJCHGC02174 protein n=1 Tax=Schistosoma japonicum TaxID=6182 RepID=Q5D912_SCHJA|nr:SJCHGC02174 protein [Schistosoma japonicum]
MDNKVQEELDLLREIFPDEFKVNFNLNQYVVTFVVTPGIGFNNPPSLFIIRVLFLNCKLYIIIIVPNRITYNFYRMCTWPKGKGYFKSIILFKRINFGTEG